MAVNKRELEEAMAYAKAQYDKLSPEEKKRIAKRGRLEVLQSIWGEELGKSMYERELMGNGDRPA